MRLQQYFQGWIRRIFGFSFHIGNFVLTVGLVNARNPSISAENTRTFLGRRPGTDIACQLRRGTRLITLSDLSKLIHFNYVIHKNQLRFTVKKLLVKLT